MKAVIYARVSSEEQLKGYSIQAQIDACQAWAKQNGYEVVVVYIEPGRSARSANRPEFQRMIKNVLAAEADAILVHKLDRFARNRADSVIYKQMLRRAGKDIISVTEPIDNSPAGVLMEGMLETIAEWYSANLSAEVIKGMVAKAKAGYFPVARPPIGYKRAARNEKGNNNGRIIIDEQTGEMIAQAFREFSTGKYSLDAWVIEAYKRGYRGQYAKKKIYKSVWQYTFRNPLYVGLIRWRGELYPGKHQPLIDKETFEKVQSILDANGGDKRKQMKRHSYLLRGLLTSSIYNKPMTGNPAKNKTGKRFYYYRAVGDGKEHNVPVSLLDDQVAEMLYAVQIIDPGKLDRVSEKLSLALTVVSNIGVIYSVLESKQARRQLLEVVFSKGSILVNKAGFAGAKVKPGLVFDKWESG